MEGSDRADIIGKKIKVRSRKDSRSLVGVVSYYDPATDCFEITFDDGLEANFPAQQFAAGAMSSTAPAVAAVTTAAVAAATLASGATARASLPTDPAEPPRPGTPASQAVRQPEGSNWGLIRAVSINPEMVDVDISHGRAHDAELDHVPLNDAPSSAAITANQQREKKHVHFALNVETNSSSRPLTSPGPPPSPSPSEASVDEPFIALSMRTKVLLSSIIGNSLEWYDFLLYVYFGPVISKQFFPDDSKHTRLMMLWGIFAMGFLTRPLGASVFGFIGDRFGRKKALMISIYLMAIPTALIGCLPTYKQAGAVAPVLLCVVRALQGLAIGGEFTGTMVFLVEHAKPQNRGLAGSWAFFSVATGIASGSAVALFFLHLLSPKQLQHWGWRVPFLFSILGSLVGGYMRKHIQEPESYTSFQSRNRPAGWTQSSLGENSTEEELDNYRPSVLETIRNHTWRVLLVVLVDFFTTYGFYIIIIFLPVYFQEYLGYEPRLVQTLNTFTTLVYGVCIPIGGWISDKYGRQRGILWPCVFACILAWPMFLIMPQGPHAAWFAQCVLAVGLAVFCGNLPATLVDLFPQDIRYSGISIGHNLSMAVFGGTAPMLATELINASHSLAMPAVLIIVAAFLSSLSIVWLKRAGID